MIIQNLKYSEHEIDFEAWGKSCRVVYAGAHAWRIQSAKDDGTFDDFGAGQVLARYLGEAPYLCREPIACERTDFGIVLTAPDGSTLSIYASPFRMEFTNADGSAGARLDCIFPRWEKTMSVVGRFAPDERIYGTGERFDRLNHRGRELKIYARDEWAQWKGNSYCPIPILCSSHGYGLFLNRYEMQEFDLDSRLDGSFMLTVKDDAPMDLYVFSSGKIADCLYGYSLISGFAPEPAEWSYGTQVCRFAPDFSEPSGVRAMMDAMDENDFPWDAVIMEGWDTYKPEKIRELKALSAYIRAKGKHVMLYQACGMIPENAESDFGMDPGFAVRRTDTGSAYLPEVMSYNPADNPDGPGSRGRRYIDVTNPDAMDWWKNVLWGDLIREDGVAGCKIDFCELFPDYLPLRFADGSSSAGWHHLYPVLYNIAMYKLYCTQPGGGMNFSRGGGIGAQRYPFIWAGDQTREFFFLKATLRGVLNSGLSGLPFLSYDMSGYMPAFDGNANPEAEVFIRGLEYTCFSANIQTHGSVARPYDFDEKTKDLYRRYAKAHDTLRPYLAEQGRIACKTALPLMRALALYDQNDETCLDCMDEYLLGDGFLVAPVLDPIDCRNVYLPTGEWEDLYTGEVYTGPKTLEDYPAPLHKIPVFINRRSDSRVLPDIVGKVKSLICTAE